MRKIYLSILLLTGGNLLAQNAFQKVLPSKLTATTFTAVTSDNINPRGNSRAVIWSDDFSNPANWVMANAGSPPADWTIGTASLPFVGKVNSTSGGNFAGFNSDALGSGSTNDATITTANPIDLTGITAVNLEWQQTYMRFQDRVYVEVSIDGTNFTPFEVNLDVDANELTPNPDFRRLDITSVAANQATVWIRFRYVGAWDYAWGIDDVQLVDPPNNDLIIKEVAFNGGTDSSAWLYYSQIPLRQAQLDTLFFGALVANDGQAVQPNTNLFVTVSGAGTYSDSSAAKNVVPAATDTFDITSSHFIPNAKGTYTVDFSAYSDSTDATPVNNVKSISFNVTDTVYARDNNVFGGGSSYAAGTGVHQLGSLFQIFTPEVATSASFLFHSATTADAPVIFHIYDGTLTNPIYSTSVVTIPDSMLGEWLTIPLPSVELIPGEYIVAYETLDPASEVWIGTGSGASNAAPYTTFANVDNGGWGYSGFIPFIRLNVENPATISIKENTSVSSVNIYPNPASLNTTLTYALASSSNVNLKVFDVTGKEVMNLNEGVKPAGNHNLNISTEKLNSGIYYYSLTANNNIITKKLVVVK